MYSTYTKLKESKKKKKRSPFPDYTVHIQSTIEEC